MYLFQLALTAVCFPSLAGGLGKTISSLWELTHPPITFVTIVIYLIHYKKKLCVLRKQEYYILKIWRPILAELSLFYIETNIFLAVSVFLFLRI